MPHRRTLAIRHDLEDMRNKYNIARRAAADAAKKGTSRIEDLPAFLFIEYALRWTAFQELLGEYEKTEAHETVGLRSERLLSWLQGLPDDTSVYESAVQEVEE